MKEMRLALRRAFAAGIVLAALAVVAGGFAIGAGTARAATVTVEMQPEATIGGKFSPASVTVNVGDTVTWKNTDPIPHTTTRAGTGAWDSGVMLKDATFSFTFTTAGSYTYACTIHPAMTGTVTVQAAATPTTPAATATTPAATATTPAATATTPAATATTPAATATPTRTPTTPAATATTPAATVAASTPANTPAAPATGSAGARPGGSRTGLYVGLTTLAAMLALGSGVALVSRRRR